MPRTPVLNFSKGEIGPQLYGRIDASQYNAALKKARNVIVQRYGGVDARPGFHVIGELAQQDQPAEIVPFQYSIDQAYVLGFQQASGQPLAFGGFVLEEDLKITSATLANPSRLAIAFHSYSVGDRGYISGLTGMDALDERIVTITAVPDANHIDIDVDTRTFNALTDSTGTVRTAAPPPPPPPPPPPTPTPTPTPPPSTGGGGGTGCVEHTTLIRMANASHTGPGRQKQAKFVKVGDYVWTRHAITRVESAYRVIGSEFMEAELYGSNLVPFEGSGGHRFDLEDGSGWQTLELTGQPLGITGTVWKATIEGAQTYISAGVLSHNTKPLIP